MPNPWEIYDALIDCLPADVCVTSTGRDLDGRCGSYLDLVGVGPGTLTAI